MIVQEPPYELVAISADADCQRLMQELVERGQERGCLRAFRWRSERHAFRDALVARPAEVVAPFLPLPSREPTRFLLVWDHVGSGRESYLPSQVEEFVLGQVTPHPLHPDQVAAVAVHPETEALLEPSWGRVKSILGQKRGVSTLPTDADILERANELQRRRRRAHGLPDDFVRAQREYPKEVLEALLSLLNLRPSPAVFKELGRALSIRILKQGDTASRVARQLEVWFPPGA